MYKFVFSFVLIVISFTIANAQVQLQRNIGLDAAPNDSDKICPIIPFLGSFDESGLAAGENAYDFTLYDRENNPLTLSKILKEKKPVLLVSGSYTCMFFRYHVPLINSLASIFGDKINIYIIYTYEAHPSVGEIPFMDSPLADSFNHASGILYPQPETYGQRKAIAFDMLKNMQINVPILFDGPCNQWISHFGPSPNIAYLIGTNGEIVSKHPILNQIPLDMSADIETYLGDSLQMDTGRFSIRLLGKDTVLGLPGSTISLTEELVNETNSDVVLEVNRINSNLPDDWETSICADVCYNSQVSSAFLRILPHSVQEFKIYFYSGKNPGKGYITLQFSNKNLPENGMIQRIFAETSSTLGLANPESDDYSIRLYPLPARDKLSIATSIPYSGIRIVNITGSTVGEFRNADEYPISMLSNGLYFIQLLSTENRIVGSQRFLKGR
jgi:hypothetical protein